MCTVHSVTVTNATAARVDQHMNITNMGLQRKATPYPTNSGVSILGLNILMVKYQKKLNTLPVKYPKTSNILTVKYPQKLNIWMEKYPTKINISMVKYPNKLNI